MIVLAIILLVLAAGALALTIKERGDFERREKANIAIEEEINKAMKTLSTREDVLNRREASLMKKEEEFARREEEIKKCEELTISAKRFSQEEWLKLQRINNEVDTLLMDYEDIKDYPTGKKLAKEKLINIKDLISEC